MDPAIYRVLGVQIIFTLLCVGIINLVTQDTLMAQSAFYGGAIALVNAFVAMRRVQKAQTLLRYGKRFATAVLYSGAAIRFVLTLILFVVGFGVLKLQVFPVLIVFAISQLAYGWSFRKKFKDQKA